jgi:integrase
VRLSEDAYVFSFDPAGRQPMHPDSVTHRFSRLAKQLGLRTRLHDLRHYAATQLIAGGVDLRTVSGRIGHAGGGAATLRVYTHFLAAADRQAAEVLEKTLRRPRPSSSESSPRASLLGLPIAAVKAHPGRSRPSTSQPNA